MTYLKKDSLLENNVVAAHHGESAGRDGEMVRHHGESAGRDGEASWRDG